MRYRHLIFDLDGTLTDPKPGITKSVQYALRYFDIHTEDLDSLTHFIGPPLRESFQVNYGFNEEESIKAVSLFREYYREKGIFDNRVYHGVIEILQELFAQNYRLYIATSKPTPFAVSIAEHFDFSQYFKEIAGCFFDGTRVNKRDIISYLIQQHQMNPSETLMIGDRKHDLIGARENGIDAVGVTFGYGSVEEITAENPSYLIHQIDELITIV